MLKQRILTALILAVVFVGCILFTETRWVGLLFSIVLFAATRELLALVPDTRVEMIERCSGHDGTYAVKDEFHDTSMKIVRPVVNRVKQAEADHYTSDCAMAGGHIANGLGDGSEPKHPLTLLRMAYGI